MIKKEIYKGTVFLDVDIAEKLRVLAKKDVRSLSNMMQKVLTDYANEHSFDNTNHTNAINEEYEKEEIETNKNEEIITMDKPPKSKMPSLKK